MYNVRDILGHFIKPKTAEARMCPHPCCRGKRPHPDKFPLLLPKDVLKSASDEELYRHFNKKTVGESGAAVGQVVAELERRERSRERKQAARERAQGRRRSAQEGYRNWLETEWVAAEGVTRGNMLNKRGRAKGIDPRSLWTANEKTRAAYASEELRQYWNAHPVLSAAEFRGGGAAQVRGARARRESALYGVY